MTAEQNTSSLKSIYSSDNKLKTEERGNQKPKLDLGSSSKIQIFFIYINAQHMSDNKYIET
jgi:hypothetical protein